MSRIKKLMVSTGIAVVLSISLALPAMASTPPGQKGYEGQPGNQGGYHNSNNNSN